MTKPHRLTLPTTALVLVLGTPVASWWLIGDLTNDEARRLAAEGVELDYAIRPVSLGPAGDRIVGVLACVGVVVALAWLLRATARRRLDPRWWWVLVPLVGAGVLVGLAWRVLTAGGIGANIGAGLMVVAGGPALTVLLIVAAVAAMRMRRPRRGPDASE
ncbi:hypothetical protein DER29_3798 [Micromonospora sp. M71_S20]|uniref:hypothetical protein n=1 Tax=Micromonospora sp. M71_S20 TaxID=592872 RepID=UPI000EB2E68B|nr:hypothetical protein [Micromonospora sp. M71_S20]RLK25787.1 hypothetical protein DER29_3798 [Micromonospora sp. M71_S20]